jgi:methylthioribose-1-phosphate isomerase
VAAPAQRTRPVAAVAAPAQRTRPVAALRFDGEALVVLDQTLLPGREEYLRLTTPDAVAEAIRRLAIRGAPLIGVAAGYGVALDPGGAEVLKAARPTAVNLAYAVDRVYAAADRLAEARAIHAEEEAASGAIAEHGAELLGGARRILTHCNTGALAAPGRGTAFAVIAELHDRGMLTGVVATESRPLLQGARLTAYELGRYGIPHELIVDSAAAGLIAAGTVDAVIVGCDRVAANGDVANKVGTYPLALAAHAAGVPFVVAGPTSTIDLDCPTGRDIVIEERDPDEVRTAAGQALAPAGTRCRNPAFDVTPARYITALVTERGVLQPDRLNSRCSTIRRESQIASPSITRTGTRR